MGTGRHSLVGLRRRRPARLGSRTRGLDALRRRNRRHSQVFLSYAPADRELAGQLANHLEREGYKVWVADDRLYPGDNWSLAIGKALEESDAMVVLLSPEAARAESVQREIDYALVSLNYRNKVIPVLVRPTKDYPWILDRFPMIRAGRSPAETSRRIAAVLRRS